ncbi:MAG: SPOR domain-containing protein [Massilia sp.]
MLKFIFWALLAANAILFAYGQGYLGSVAGAEHEPQRMKNQLNADKLRLVASASVTSSAAASVAAAVTPAAACFEVGNFSAAEARRFEARLAPLALGERMQRVTLAGAEASGHIVYIPSLGSKEAAERKAGELKARGVTDYFIMSDGGAMKWAISLGVFKSEAAAQTLLAALVKQGVQSARIGTRGGAASKLAYQFRSVDGALRTSVDDIAGSFASPETRACAKADQS